MSKFLDEQEAFYRSQGFTVTRNGENSVSWVGGPSVEVFTTYMNVSPAVPEQASEQPSKKKRGFW